jgi:hypothetical protein
MKRAITMLYEVYKVRRAGRETSQSEGIKKQQPIPEN